MSKAPFTDIATITQDETLLILAPRPWDAAQCCGGLIARSCRRGRPPIVMVLGDGSSSHPAPPVASLPAPALADRHAAETRLAMQRLVLDPDRLLMAGVFDAALAQEGLFAAMVAAVIQVMWRTDCNIVCAPLPDRQMARTAHDVARAVATASGVGHLGAGGGAAGWRLDIRDDLAAKRAACAAHTLMPPGEAPTGAEIYRRFG